MNRPQVTLKLATSLDGKIALENGQSEWITGEEARHEGRRLRANHDAIIIGAKTALTDNPQLTTRIDGEPNPLRVVFDSQLRLSLHSNLVQTAKETPVVMFCAEAANKTEKAQQLKSLGVQVFSVEKEQSGLNPQSALNILWKLGIKTALLEGGGTLAASFIKWDLIDHIEWFRASIILGAEGRPCIGQLGLKDMNQLYRFNRISVSEVGVDLWERYSFR